MNKFSFDISSTDLEDISSLVQACISRGVNVNVDSGKDIITLVGDSEDVAEALDMSTFPDDIYSAIRECKAAKNEQRFTEATFLMGQHVSKIEKDSSIAKDRGTELPSWVMKKFLKESCGL